jgi:hypothetical protein
MNMALDGNCGVVASKSTLEDCVHVEEEKIRHAELASLKAGNVFGFAHPFDCFQRVNLLALIFGNCLDVTFVAWTGHVVNCIASEIGEIHTVSWLDTGLHNITSARTKIKPLIRHYHLDEAACAGSQTMGGKIVFFISQIQVKPQSKP